jgi:hypothetical protein
MKRHKTLTLTTELHERQMLEAGFEPATKGLLEFPDAFMDTTFGI